MLNDFYGELKDADNRMVKYYGISKMYEECVDKKEKSAANILKFLIEWKTRGVTDKGLKGKRFKKNLANALKYIKKNCTPIINKHLNSVNLEMVKKTIKDLYGILADIKGFGPTATSKILHILFPDLFVMWDQKIIAAYKESGKIHGTNANLYVSFLKLMQEQAKKYSKKHKPRFWTLKIARKPSIPKLIDEYNYLTYTKEQKI